MTGNPAARALPAIARPAAPDRRALGRRMALALPLAFAACGPSTSPRTDFPPLTFDYLTKLRINVASIEIDDSWRGSPNPREVGAYAPISPVAALRQMATERLGAGGASGKAVFSILDASLINNRSRVDGSLAVRLAVTSADGTRSGYSEARVARSMTLVDDDPATLRDALYTLVKQAMDDMNVEFEFQVRRSLKDWLQTTATSAPLPAAVQSQDLAPPPGIQAAPSPQPQAPPQPAPPSYAPGPGPAPSMLTPPAPSYPAAPYPAPAYSAPPYSATPYPAAPYSASPYPGTATPAPRYPGAPTYPDDQPD